MGGYEYGNPVCNGRIVFSADTWNATCAIILSNPETSITFDLPPLISVINDHFIGILLPILSAKSILIIRSNGFGNVILTS